jgi:hypothetical protein
MQLRWYLLVSVEPDGDNENQMAAFCTLALVLQAWRFWYP